MHWRTLVAIGVSAESHCRCAGSCRDAKPISLMQKMQKAVRTVRNYIIRQLRVLP